MSDKYGAPMASVPFLLRRAAELGLRVRGVSFHVGSGCYSASAFADAIQAAIVHGRGEGRMMMMLVTMVMDIAADACMVIVMSMLANGDDGNGDMLMVDMLMVDDGDGDEITPFQI